MNSSKQPKVIICGGGIGGLTVAHELSKKNFDVTVYERNNIVGGLARSNYYVDKQNNFRYPTEYSWRVYGTRYYNLLRILSEIPLKNKPAASVHDNLVQFSTYIFPRFDEQEVVVDNGSNTKKLATHFKKGDLRKITNKLLFCLTASTERIDSLDHLTWNDYCGDLSEEANKFMVRMWGPALGMDPTYMSFPVIARVLRVLLSGLVPGNSAHNAYHLYVMNQPTNDAWFDEWTNYLQTTRGVKIKTNCEVLDLKTEDGKISGVIVRDKTTGATNEDHADYYVCSLSAEAIASIVEKNNQLAAHTTLKNTVALAKKCRQIQLSVQIFLDQKIIYPTPNDNVLYLPDSPWALIIEPEDMMWRSTHSTDPRVKSVLSVGICQTDVPGILHKKPYTLCTEKEVEEEVWAQIIKSCHASGIKTEAGKTLETTTIILFYMWDSFYYNKEKNIIDVWEPKFSNNAGSLGLQPPITTEIPNLFFATAYAKTNTYIFSMEAAAEAGVKAANEILKKHTIINSVPAPLTPVFSFATTPVIFRPLQYIDRILFKLKLPHLSRLLFKSSIAIVSIYLLLPFIILGVMLTQLF